MPAVTQIKKRSGEIVDFAPEKIGEAVQKAFDATLGSIDEEIIDGITQNVVSDLNKAYHEGIPTVEDVQDIVEKEIFAAGFHEVARAYIIYRHEHSKIRTDKKEKSLQETIKKIERQALLVTAGTGKTEPFQAEKIKNVLEETAAGLESIDIEGLVSQISREIYDGIKTEEIAKALTMVTRSWIEKDPVYSDLAARLLHRTLYKEVVGATPSSKDFDKNYREALKKSIEAGVKIGRLDKRMLDFDLERLGKVLEPKRDNLFKFLGAQTFYDRYYIQNPETKERLETPQILWMRVAMGLAINEKDRDSWAIKFYEVMSTLRYIPSTPTLFHAGTNHPQLSSCYLNTVNDSLDHIFKVIGDNAQLSKWSGGIGTDWTNLRGTGALIRGIGVESQGVIPFLKVSNDATHAINRSGRRRGAACVYLETWHYDIEAFLELRKNTGDERRRTHDIDTANWIPDLFMKRVRDDENWTLFSPDETPDLHDLYGKSFGKRYEEYEKMASLGKINLYKTIKAKDLWKKMLAMLFETGHPWLTWKDPSNIRSPQDHVGVVHSSNLCTEITLNTSDSETAVCNLGSINLPRHLKPVTTPNPSFIKEGNENIRSPLLLKEGQGVVNNGTIQQFNNYVLDKSLIKDTVTIAMRMLDNVVDINFYPTAEAKNSNLKHRPIGLGVMGLQDIMYRMDINFDSEEAVDLADYSQELVSYYAYLSSSQLAEERGTYASYKGSKWDRGILPQDTLDMLERERSEKIEVSRIERLDWKPVRESIKKHGMRNSNCLAIAPTATISNIAGSTPTIEPIYKNIYVKANASGDFIVVNPYLVSELKEVGLWDEAFASKLKYHDGSIAKITEIPIRLRAKYKEVFEIDAKWLIKAAAYRGKWIDQSQSLNIYYAGSSGADLSDIYFYAWSMGLKTTYYLRTLAKSQVEKSTVDIARFGVTHQRRKSEILISKSETISNTEISNPKKSVISNGVQVKLDEARNPQIDAPIPVPELKLCRIDDPNCESCQ